MADNNDTSFKELEKLNAQIDVWIDEEDFEKINNTLIASNKEDLDICFTQGEIKHVTHYTKWENSWIKILAGHVVKAGEITLNDKLEELWPYLFYAKLLRAKIQQKSYSNCYTRRLDEVAAYLEKHRPAYIEGEDKITRLNLMYLLELSAVCQLSESQGYSERARRLITNATYLKRPGDYAGKAPYEFYELWAHYNIGVAYFHQGEYRKAVLEFNLIIWQVEKWEKDKRDDKKKAEAEECLKFFTDDNDRGFKGRELLFLPAKLYRAEVQLKLQLAYHALKTICDHENTSQDANSNNGWGSEHNEIRALIIKTQAYQLLGRLDMSWDMLKKLYEPLAKVKDVVLDDRLRLKFPKDDVIHKYPRLGERFLGILIEDHLQWLLLEGNDPTQPAPCIAYLIQEPKEKIAPKDCEKVDEAFTRRSEDIPYQEEFRKAFSKYWSLVEHHADNRRGYFQQVSKYLKWLAKAADVNINAYPGDNSLLSEAKNVCLEVAVRIFKDNKKGLLKPEQGLDIGKRLRKQKSKCQYCDFRGIDLRRIQDEHYTWFTEAMFTFFDSKSINGLLDKGAIGEDKKYFIKRLLKLERNARDNLRINDLKLHYSYYEEEELLRRTIDWWKRRICNIREGKEGKEWCWQGVSQENITNFVGLLPCIPKNKGSSFNGGSLVNNDYEKIMMDWENYFIRHLESPSIHECEIGKNQFYFVGLQRWNSSSPAKGYSVGGGYLLYHLDPYKDGQVDMGIAIDPGFDFVRNLFHSGFSLDDIDIILISHAHVDHIRDFESIITLFNELKKRRQRERRVHVILSLGAYKRLEHIVKDPGLRYFIEPYIIDIDREIDDTYFEKLGKCKQENGAKSVFFEFERVPREKTKPSRRIERIRAILPENQGKKNYCLKIKPTRAYHIDHTYSDSFGFLIELNDDFPERNIIFGYTGDTKWVYPKMPDPFKGDKIGDKFKDIADQYKECDALVVHLGSLIKRVKKTGKYLFRYYDQCIKNTNAEYRCEMLIRDGNHPYMIGMLRLLSSLSRHSDRDKHSSQPLILISEFGEELRGQIRRDFVERLQKTYNNKLTFLPVDVGLTVHLCRRGEKPSNDGGNNCTCKVWCVQCEKFVYIVDADFAIYGTDHAIYCVCKTCLKSTPTDVLQNRLRQLYEIGFDVRVSPEL